jgi:hypothetical protein
MRGCGDCCPGRAALTPCMAHRFFVNDSDARSNFAGLESFPHCRQHRLFCSISLALTLLFISSAGTGCRSTTESKSSGLASVEIRGNTPGQIRDVTVQVFRDNGYIVVRTEPSKMTFEKKGSKMDDITYGSWLDTIWVRVEASIEPVAERTFRLQCRARLLQGRGDMEEEMRHAYVRSGPYQALLDEVAKRLGQNKPTTE